MFKDLLFLLLIFGALIALILLIKVIYSRDTVCIQGQEVVFQEPIECVRFR